MEAQKEKLQEMFNKELEDLKNNNQQYSNWSAKYSRRINSKIAKAEEQISEVDDNGGKYCRRNGWRKKNEKNWR